MSAPAIPAGYRRLKAGEKRPKGYGIIIDGEWYLDGGNNLVGKRITSEEMDVYGPYIAPARKARKEGGKR